MNPVHAGVLARAPVRGPGGLEAAVADVDGWSDGVAGRFHTLLGELVERAQDSTPDHLAELVSTHAGEIGLADVVVYLADYGQTRLVPLPYAGMPERGTLSVEGTMAGRAYRTAISLDGDADGGGGHRLWLPLLDGSERIGVLEATLPDTSPDTGVPPGLRVACRQYARVVAGLVVGRWAYGDVFEIVRRERPMRLPAEIQWKLLPPTTFATDRLVIAGVLEPWDEVGGDAFDYAVNGDVAHLALFDAMGHQLSATLLSTVAVGGYRNARRARLDLRQTYAAIDRDIAAQFGRQAFVTGLLIELDSRTGALRWISAGHLPPLLLRDGRLVKTLTGRPATPMGLRLLRGEPPVHSEQLEPGDRIVAYTDGVVEARKHGEFFTEERLADFVERESASGHSPPEVLRRLINGVLSHQRGQLQDDATIMLVEWKPGATPPAAGS
jgi:serine phosphatase RsbU (regulator of sigma subunit)